MNQTLAMSPQQARAAIENAVTTHDVVLFMKGTVDFPMCGFSARVVGILDHLNITFLDVNVLADDTLRQIIKEYSSWPTIPQLYVKGEFVGGCDIISEMFESGEFQEFLHSRGIAFTPPAS